MNNDIETTVLSALPQEVRRYREYIVPVVSALTERDIDIAKAVVAEADRRGLDEQDVKRVLEDAGLVVPVDEPEPMSLYLDEGGNVLLEVPQESEVNNAEALDNAVNAMNQAALLMSQVADTLANLRPSS